MKFLLPLAFLGLFNYGSEFEAKAACKAWVKEGGTYSVVTSKRERVGDDWKTVTKPRTYSWRKCDWSELKTTQQVLGFNRRCNLHNEPRCNWKVKKHFRF